MYQSKLSFKKEEDFQELVGVFNDSIFDTEKEPEDNSDRVDI